jgi:hypothetical protein
MATDGADAAAAVPLDDRLIDEVEGVVRDARRRAPQDFLFAISVVLGAIAVALLALGWVTGGVLQSVLLNLGTEVLGAWLTVVLIDGLWRRLEAGATASLDAIGAKVEARRGRPMTADEREAWRAFVDEYRTLVAAESLPDRLRALPDYHHRMKTVADRGNRTLEEFERIAVETPLPPR